jgi:hypothetical protein
LLQPFQETLDSQLTTLLLLVVALVALGIVEEVAVEAYAQQ